MRPTIPVGPWRIAVDLPATRAIQNHPGTPAHGCQCTWCATWSALCLEVLPSGLGKQLVRACIDVARPSELYAFDETEGGAFCRVVYHVIGKILSGPPEYIDDPGMGTLINYRTLRERPEVLLIVAPDRHRPVEQPGVSPGGNKGLLQVDLRLDVPHKASPVTFR